jgi:hypothetical protein
MSCLAAERHRMSAAETLIERQLVPFKVWRRGDASSSSGAGLGDGGIGVSGTPGSKN